MSALLPLISHTFYVIELQIKYKYKYKTDRWEKGNQKRKVEYTGPPPSYIDLEQGLPDYQAATRYILNILFIYSYDHQSIIYHNPTIPSGILSTVASDTKNIIS